MKTKELEERVAVGICTGGHFKVTIRHRGSTYTCTSTDTLAYDRISDHRYGTPDKEINCGYTYKQALEALYYECKRAYDLI